MFQLQQMTESVTQKINKSPDILSVNLHPQLHLLSIMFHFFFRFSSKERTIVRAFVMGIPATWELTILIITNLFYITVRAILQSLKKVYKFD